MLRRPSCNPSNPRRPFRALLGRMRAPLLAAGLLLFAASTARAEPLTATESARLARGETVIREHTLTHDREPGQSARYVGGVTYTVLDAPAAEVSAMLEDVESYRRVFPRTKRVKLIAVEPDGDRLVELVQGNALVEAEYTIRVRHYPARREVRFWLEPSRPHEIDDAWGYFRVEPFAGASGEPRVLLTYAILVDVGPGIVRDMFEERIRAVLMSVPQLVRRHLAEARR